MIDSAIIVRHLLALAILVAGPGELPYYIEFEFISDYYLQCRLIKVILERTV